MRRQIPIVLSSLALVLVAGCGSPEPPVGAVEVTPSRIELPHSGFERVRLDWAAESPLAGLVGELRVMAHLYDSAGELTRTFDHPFPGPWRPGSELGYSLEIFQSALSPPLALGDHTLMIGLYDEGGNRWSVRAGGDNGAAAIVTIAEQGAGFPEFYFSSDWLPIEPGTDQQILARRWLAGDGALRVGQIGQSGSVWMRLGIPSGSNRQEMMLDEGAVEPTASVAACSGFEAQLAGTGSHTLEIPLPLTDEGPGECEITVSANFVLISKENAEKRTVALENLAWTAAAAAPGG